MSVDCCVAPNLVHSGFWVSKSIVRTVTSLYLCVASKALIVFSWARQIGHQGAWTKMTAGALRAWSTLNSAPSNGRLPAAAAGAATMAEAAMNNFEGLMGTFHRMLAAPSS